MLVPMAVHLGHWGVNLTFLGLDSSFSPELGVFRVQKNLSRARIVKEVQAVQQVVQGLKKMLNWQHWHWYWHLRSQELQSLALLNNASDEPRVWHVAEREPGGWSQSSYLVTRTNSTTCLVTRTNSAI